MSIKTLFTIPMALAFACACFATPTAEITPGVVSVSASAHSISDGADAHSRIYDAHMAVTPKLGITAEVAEITDDAGKSDISTFYLRRTVLPPEKGRPNVAAYAGWTWLSVEDGFGGESDRTGLTIGAVADLNVRPELTLYGRAGIAFLDESLWTFDTGLRYEIRPRWLLSMGYRSYDVGGSSFGGFLAGATYRL